MRIRNLTALLAFPLLSAFGAALLSGCKETTTTEPPPPAATMSFKQGARYEYTTYHTAAANPAQRSDSARHVWTCAQNNATVQGKANVAIYVDSIFGVSGTTVQVIDSAYIRQESGNNDIYRFQSLAPELDFGGVATASLDLGRQWMHEARLNATSAGWIVGEASDTVQYDLGLPGLEGMRIRLTDTAATSSTESVTIGSESFQATKTVHRLTLHISALITLPVVGQTSVGLATSTLNRTTWTVPELGTVVREEREGKVISLDYQGQSYSLPVPGYMSVMTQIIARGS